MTSQVLKEIGLGNVDIGIILIVFFVIIIANIVISTILILNNSKLKKKYNTFMMGKDAKSLEEEITELFEINSAMAERVKENRKDIRKLYKKQAKAFQKIGVVKYDAYQRMGGMLSFSLALLDEDDNGIILNSVHSTDGCYTYSKEIVNGQCSIELGNEEKIALENAIQNKN